MAKTELNRYEKDRSKVNEALEERLAIWNSGGREAYDARDEFFKFIAERIRGVATSISEQSYGFTIDEDDLAGHGVDKIVSLFGTPELHGKKCLYTFLMTCAKRAMSNAIRDGKAGQAPREQFKFKMECQKKRTRLDEQLAAGQISVTDHAHQLSLSSRCVVIGEETKHPRLRHATCKHHLQDAPSLREFDPVYDRHLDRVADFGSYYAVDAADETETEVLIRRFAAGDNDRQIATDKVVTRLGKFYPPVHEFRPVSEGNSTGVSELVEIVPIPKRELGLVKRPYIEFEQFKSSLRRILPLRWWLWVESLELPSQPHLLANEDADTDTDEDTEPVIIERRVITSEEQLIEYVRGRYCHLREFFKEPDGTFLAFTVDDVEHKTCNEIIAIVCGDDDDREIVEERVKSLERQIKTITDEKSELWESTPRLNLSTEKIKYVTGEQLGKLNNTSQAAVWKRLKKAQERAKKVQLGKEISENIEKAERRKAARNFVPFWRVQEVQPGMLPVTVWWQNFKRFPRPFTGIFNKGVWYCSAGECSEPVYTEEEASSHGLIIPKEAEPTRIQFLTNDTPIVVYHEGDLIPRRPGKRRTDEAHAKKSGPHFNLAADSALAGREFVT